MTSGLLTRLLRLLCGIILVPLLSLPAVSQEFMPADTRTRILDPFIRTLKLSNPDNFMAPPVIRLNTDDRLVLTFDELGDDRSDFSARLIHCDADWRPSRLLESEYMEGFNIEPLQDAAFSSNTFIHFVNYRFEIPSGELRPVLPGNYLLQVFDHDRPEETILQARFQVVDPLTSVTGGVTSRTDRGTNTSYQQLDLAIDLQDYPVGNPYSDLIVKVSQNQRPDTERTLAPPMNVEGKRLHYSHQPGLIFPGFNEFRRFETVRATYPGMHTDSVRYIEPVYHAFLTVDHDRSQRPYIYDQTQSGRFLIREYNATDSDLGADYITVHFTLDFPELIDADIYVDGEMTQYLYTDANRMSYDFNDRMYHLEMPLKQGSYNYQYVVLPRSSTEDLATAVGQPGVVEGSSYETRNEYQVSVYHRPPGARFDRLIGAATIYSY